MSITVVILFAFLITCVNAGQRMYADGNDIIAYYGLDTPAGTSGYSYAISTEDGVFYMSDEQANLLAKHDYGLRQLIEYDLSKYSGSFMPDAVSFGSNGINYLYTIDHSRDTDMFELQNTQNFAFEYKSGQRVGYNYDANVITKLYNPDGSEMK